MTGKTYMALEPLASGKYRAHGAIRTEVIRPLDRKQFRQMSPGAVDAALDGADGTTADIRNFFVRKTQCADEYERLPLIRRQLAERDQKFRHFHMALLI